MSSRKTIPALTSLGLSLTAGVACSPVVGTWVLSELNGEEAPITYTYTDTGGYTYAYEASGELTINSDMSGEMVIDFDYEVTTPDGTDTYSESASGQVAVENISGDSYRIDVTGDLELGLDCTLDGRAMLCVDEGGGDILGFDKTGSSGGAADGEVKLVGGF